MKKSILFAVLTFAVSSAPTSAQTKTKEWAFVSVNGSYQNPSVQPPAVTGTVALNAEFKDVYGSVLSYSGQFTIVYTIDGQAVSPYITGMTQNFAWNWDSTSVADGVHAIGVQFVNEPSQTSYTFMPMYDEVVVENHGVIPQSTPQKIPLVNWILYPFGPETLTPALDWVQWTGSVMHRAAIANPYTATIAPAGGANVSGWYNEQLAGPLSEDGETLPQFYQRSDNALVSGALYVDNSAFADPTAPYVFAQAGFDGGRLDSQISPYSTYAWNPSGTGWVGIDLSGRIFTLGLDGTVTTIAGPSLIRTNIPYYYKDLTNISVSQRNGVYSTLGNFNAPTDLAFDPSNSNTLYVADFSNHRIAKVDLSVEPPQVTTFAGVAGTPGYADGTLSAAKFNYPVSIAIASDGSIYVADQQNSAIRKISNGIVITVVKNPVEPSLSVVAGAPLTYAPLSAVPFSSAYINYPYTIRFDSSGNLVELESVTKAVRYVNLQASTVTTIARLSTSGDAPNPWLWLDVDRWGNIGPKDSIYVAGTTGGVGNTSVYQVPIAGTTSIPPQQFIPFGPSKLMNGVAESSGAGHLLDTFGHYPWAVAISSTQGRFITAGFGSWGVASFHILQPSDPTWVYDDTHFTNGRTIWVNGTSNGTSSATFPFGARPSFSAVHGQRGHAVLGNVQDIDQMAAMTDAALTSYLQNGADGAVPRPEITGCDLNELIYYIRRSAQGGDTASYTACTLNAAAPVISSISSTTTTTTSVTVSWTTDVPTIGLVKWGTTAGQEFAFTLLESSYRTSHSVTVTNMPVSTSFYFVIVSKETSGASAMSPEQQGTT